jgi:hypothetical protein
VILVTFLLTVTDISSTDNKKCTYHKLSHCGVWLHRSVPCLICSSFYTHHVIIAFGKPLWRCRNHSLKSISHHNFFRCIKSRVILYIDNSASHQTLRLFVAVRKCWVTPAGNKFWNTFSFSFLKENKLLYEIPRVLFNCSLYLCNCIWGGQECHFVYTQRCFCSAMRVQRGEELRLHTFWSLHCKEVSSYIPTASIST